MTATHPIRHSTGIQPVWYLAPLVWPAIAALLFVVDPDWHGRPAALAQAQQSGTGMAPSVAPDASVGETAVPSATGVFTKPATAAVEYSDAF